MLSSRSAWLAALLALSGAAAHAAPPSPMQATYDAAQRAYDKGDWTAAARGFRAVLPARAGAGLSRSEAVIASRLAASLLHLGRLEEARGLATRAAAALPASDPGELANAWETVGDAARFGFDYPAAAVAYARARDLATAAGDAETRLDARIGLALSLVTVDPMAAAATLDTVLDDKATAAALGKPRLAQVVDLRARAAMIGGDLPAATRLAERALDLSGGLTTSNVSAAQVAIRNDAALVYGLRHEDERTRQYLTYTGAGHQRDVSWVAGYTGELPVCGEQGDVAPDDVAVVQFAIDEHGEVKGALPIYVSRIGAMGAVFARQVSTWRWNPDAVKSVSPFWRSTLVLQLRCQTRPTPQALGLPVYAALADWLRARGVDTSPQALMLPVAADDARLEGSGADAVGPLLSRADRNGAAISQHVAEVLAANGAPAAAYAILYAKDAERAGARAGMLHTREAAAAAALAVDIPTLAARAPDDPSLAWLRMQRALDLEQAHDFRAAAKALDEVLATPSSVLPEGAPIRRVALLHAGLAARRLGQGAGAGVERRIAASGLTPDQCSLFDTHPILDGHSIGSSYFPQEAMRWGFEGFVREAFDIAGDGRVANIRTVVAYPPFVFDRTSELAARTFRYLPPRIGDRSVGCTGQVQGIQYRIGS